MLGAALGLAPLAAYVVIRGEASLTAWLLAIAVLLFLFYIPEDAFAEKVLGMK